MIGRLGTETGGFTLVEVLIAATLMVVAGGALLSTLTEFGTNAARADRQNDAQQEARRALAAVAAELRNLASPTNELPQAVERAEPLDLVFQTIARTKPAGSSNARNVVRVRYCLDQAAATLWRYEQSWTTAAAPAMPATADCAATASGWPPATAVATMVRNGSRPVFTFNSAIVTQITEIHATLFVDLDPAKRPAEVRHESTSFLRNQNRAPLASFTAVASGSKIQLNGSKSTDPEGRALEYFWYDNGGSAAVGSGIIFTYSPGQAGEHSLTLTVRDPAGLEASAPAQTVCVVGGDTACP